MNDIVQSEEILAELASKQDTLDYLSNYTGKEISSYANIFGLYQTLSAETFLNYSLPEWAQSVYPGTITEMATRQCELEVSTPNLKKLFGGKNDNDKRLLLKIKCFTLQLYVWIFLCYEYIL